MTPPIIDILLIVIVCNHVLYIFNAAKPSSFRILKRLLCQRGHLSERLRLQVIFQALSKSYALNISEPSDPFSSKASRYPNRYIYQLHQGSCTISDNDGVRNLPSQPAPSPSLGPSLGHPRARAMVGGWHGMGKHPIFNSGSRWDHLAKLGTALCGDVEC